VKRKSNEYLGERMLRRTGLFFGATALCAALTMIIAPSAFAAAEQFYRFEEEATANWTVTEACDDGTSVTTLVSVIGGLEFESPDLNDVNEFVTIRIRGFGCDGTFTNEFGTGSADYTGSPSLKEAHVTGTVTLSSGAVAVINVSWTATGKLETTINTAQFPGFAGIFTGSERDAVATGSVVVDGVNLVSGQSSSASIETLEDRNTSTGAGG
jgi:hypothetical protein